MFRVEKISSFDAPELQPYATMRRPLEQERQGIFVAEGTKVVRRLLESSFVVVSVVLPEKWLAEFRPLLETRPEPITVYLADKKLLETLVGFSMFQGVLAVGKIPPPISLDDILQEQVGTRRQASRRSGSSALPDELVGRAGLQVALPPRAGSRIGQSADSPFLFVAVDALTNAENLGALVRNCVAFGVQALIVGETSSSPFLRRAVRNSMGTIFQLPVIELGRAGSPLPAAGRPYAKTGAHGVTRPTSQSLVDVLHDLRKRGVRCLAAHPHTNNKLISQADFTKDCCLVFGSEGDGISSAVLEACDEAVAIPMPPAVDSLNVGAAAAVFLYEVARQRRQV
jgi:tRNA G18 (ribose-2'-O)-methylase SpoU